MAVKVVIERWVKGAIEGDGESVVFLGMKKTIMVLQ